MADTLKFFEKKEQERGWNMAVAYLQQLDRRRDESALSYSVGDLLKTLRIYQVIYRDIHFKVGEIKNNKQIIDLFDSIKERLYREQIHHNEKVSAEEELFELGLLLNDAMYDLHLIFGKDKEKKSIEEQMAEDFDDS